MEKLVFLRRRLVLGRLPVGVGEERLGFRDEARRAYAAVEVERSLDLTDTLVRASYVEQALARA